MAKKTEEALKLGAWCKLTQMPLNRECEPGACETCGFNPEINSRRRQQIYWYAKHGLLHLWGQAKKSDPAEAAQECAEMEKGCEENEG